MSTTTKFHAVCRSSHKDELGHVVACDLNTDYASSVADGIEAYLWHLKVAHNGGRKLRRPFGHLGWPVRLWSMPKPKADLYVPEAFGIGDDVEWEDNGQVLRGQVWALSPKPNHRWIADGVRFHEVRTSELGRPIPRREEAA